MPGLRSLLLREVNLSKVYIVLLGFSSHEGVRGPLADHPRRTAAD
jgi:hypothetical protein